MRKNDIRSGSALVVVLGMTAVLMIMAVAFSVFMRAERSGMTNLKHALTARQTTHTAIARVMSAIDQSFGNPTNNWPIPPWDPPYISSWAGSDTGTQHWQNASISSSTDRRDNARILTDELSRHLSPSQVALVKNAKVDWVTILGGVGASEATTQYGPKKDMILARYAFLAFNTTGLLDMNIGPLTNATDALNQAAIQDTAFVDFLSGKGGPAYMARRSDLGRFSSYAEMWRSLLGDTRYDYYNDLEADDIITPDLFTTFSTSLDEVGPDGAMKLFIPRDTSEAAFGDSEKKAYANLALKRFEHMFKHEQPEVKLATDPLPELTRAQLATQALVDYLDKDSKPDGGIWEGSPPDPLNYPCTEDVPMINQAYAGFEVGELAVVRPDSAEPTTWYKPYAVRLMVTCRAQYFGENTMPADCDMTGAFELVEFKDFIEKVFADSSGGAGTERMVFVGGRPWAGEGSISDAERVAYAANTAMAPSGGAIADMLAITGEKEFEVRVYPKTTTTDPEPAVLGWHAFSLPEETGDTTPMFAQVRVSAEVVSAGDGTVQQVPAPAFPPPGSGFTGADYRLRLDAGINPKRTGIGGEPYAVGWAFCVDPRFAYNTRSIETYPGGDSIIAWVTSEMCSPDGSIRGENRIDYRPMWEVADLLEQLELDGNIFSGPGELNRMVDRVIFRNFGADKLSSENTRKLMNAFANRQKIYPDIFHSDRSGGSMFIDNGENKQTAFQIKIANEPMTSLSEFGNLLIGPWETLSLYGAFAPGTSETKVDFHRVSDYFSLTEARFPKVDDIPASGLDSIAEEYLPAIHAGKLNLNPQLKVECDDTAAGSGHVINTFNQDPLSVVLATAPLDDTGARMPFAEARNVAADFFEDVAISGQGDTDPFPMFRYASDIGNVNISSNANPMLSAVVATGVPTSDAEREGFLGNVLDRLTTRGQTYLVVVRADAYTPKYGTVRAQGGTTLATEYALLELWRDSEPNRYPDGGYFPDETAETTAPVHGWFIRSCRFFSP